MILNTKSVVIHVGAFDLIDTGDQMHLRVYLYITFKNSLPFLTYNAEDLRSNKLYSSCAATIKLSLHQHTVKETRVDASVTMKGSHLVTNKGVASRLACRSLHEFKLWPCVESVTLPCNCPCVDPARGSRLGAAVTDTSVSTSCPFPR